MSVVPINPGPKWQLDRVKTAIEKAIKEEKLYACVDESICSPLRISLQRGGYNVTTGCIIHGDDGFRLRTYIEFVYAASKAAKEKAEADLQNKLKDDNEKLMCKIADNVLGWHDHTWPPARNGGPRLQPCCQQMMHNLIG